MLPWRVTSPAQHMIASIYSSSSVFRFPPFPLSASRVRRLPRFPEPLPAPSPPPSLPARPLRFQFLPASSLHHASSSLALYPFTALTPFAAPLPPSPPSRTRAYIVQLHSLIHPLYTKQKRTQKCLCLVVPRTLKNQKYCNLSGAGWSET